MLNRLLRVALGSRRSAPAPRRSPLSTLFTAFTRSQAAGRGRGRARRRF